MGKTEKVKDEVVTLIMHNLGKPAANAFAESYATSTMPIFLDTAVSVLSDMVGLQKAQQAMNEILSKNSMKGLQNVS